MKLISSIVPTVEDTLKNGYSEKVKAHRKAYNARPEVKAHRKAYNARPEVKAYYKAYDKAYYQREKKENPNENPL